MAKKRSLAVLFCLLAASSALLAQTLQTLVNQPPDGVGISFLMTDGTVITQGNGESDWAQLTLIAKSAATSMEPWEDDSGTCLLEIRP